MKPYYDKGGVTIHAGDCVEVMAQMDAASVDAVVTDPPYGLEFMGKEWDRLGGDQMRHAKPGQNSAGFFNHSGHARLGQEYAKQDVRAAQAWHESWAREALRVLKPGGHLLAFGGTRTYHRLACAVEDAGFEIRDTIAWMYGSGFPKSLDVFKAIDKAAGAERDVVGRKGGRYDHGFTPESASPLGRNADRPNAADNMERAANITAPATDAAKEWDGWGTALKPAHEPVVVARKPLVGTVAANVQAHGTGALNVDGCRIEATPEDVAVQRARTGGEMGEDDGRSIYGKVSRLPAGNDAGRWPANVCLDEEAAAMLDEQSGDVASGSRAAGDYGLIGGHGRYGEGGTKPMPEVKGSTGGASRFFYTAKASRAEREGETGGAKNTHPTVKPLDLMRWLVRLVTPPGGVVLDPFLGSGTTAVAARDEGFRCVGIERETDYIDIAVKRLAQGVLNFGGEA